MSFPFLPPAAVAALLLSLALAGPAAAQGLGQTFSGLQVSGDQPIAIESDALDIDDANATATFTGNVSVSQGETQLRAGLLVVHYAQAAEGTGGSATSGALQSGSGQIERLEASETVYIRSAEQVATAETATFDMASQVVVMTGEVVLSQGENVAQGCKLTIQMETGLARLESCGGRTSIVLTPGEAASN